MSRSNSAHSSQNDLNIDANISTTNVNNNEIGNYKYPLSFLISLLPKEIDSRDRQAMQITLSNLDHAFRLADNETSHPLFIYVQSKLTGPIRALLQGKSFNTWPELRNILKLHYKDTKSYFTLLQELQLLRQNANESLLSYYDRVDQLTTRTIQAVVIDHPDEEIGKIQSIRDLQLSRFLYHCHPEISRFLRSQKINNINEALNLGLDEENALKTIKNDTKYSPSNSFQKYCTFCKKTGHDKSKCYNLNKINKSHEPKPIYATDLNDKKPSCSFCGKIGHIIDHCFKKKNNQSSNSQNVNPSVKFCRYCRNRGHEIANCRKKAYNDANNQSSNENTNSRNVNLSNIANSSNSSTLICRYCRNVGHDLDHCRKRAYVNAKRASVQQLSTNSVNISYARQNAESNKRCINYSCYGFNKLSYDPNQEFRQTVAQNNRTVSNKKCNYCHLYGHLIVDCKKRIKANNNKNNNMVNSSFNCSNSKSNSQLFCRYCRRTGHEINSCMKLTAKRINHNENSNQSISKDRKSTPSRDNKIFSPPKSSSNSNHVNVDRLPSTNICTNFPSTSFKFNPNEPSTSIAKFTPINLNGLKPQVNALLVEN